MRSSCRVVERAYLPSIRGLILLGLLAGISSCASIAPQTAALSENSLSSWDTGELLQRLDQRLRKFRSLRTLATVSYWGADGRAGFQEAVLVDRPNRLRLETLSPLGAILIVTVDADEIVGFHPREGLFYRGRSSKDNLFRYTRIPLELGELTSLLMGLPPMEGEDRWEVEESAVYRKIAAGGKERIAFHPTLGIPTKWERMSPDGEIELTALFSDFFSTPAGLFPLKVSLEAHTQQQRLEIRYQEPELNIVLPFGLFVQEKPENVREMSIKSLGG